MVATTLIFLVEAYLKPVLGHSSEISYCKINFHNVELYEINTEVKIILKQEIIKLFRLSTTESVRDEGFSFPWISIRTRSLISSKCICNLIEYIG